MSEWQPVVGWDHAYQVNELGVVRKMDGTHLSQWLNSCGYMLVRLSQPRAVERVHRIVAQAFVANPDGKPFVNHLNSDRSDNRATNLEWCTQAENLAHMTSQGRRAAHRLGVRPIHAKLTQDQIEKIRASTDSHSRLAGLFGVSKRTIGRVKSGAYYKHDGAPE